MTLHTVLTLLGNLRQQTLSDISHRRAARHMAEPEDRSLTRDLHWWSCWAWTVCFGLAV